VSYPCKDNLLTENPLQKFYLNSVYEREHTKQRYAKLISNERINLSLRIKDYYCY